MSLYKVSVYTGAGSVGVSRPPRASVHGLFGGRGVSVMALDQGSITQGLLTSNLRLASL